MLTFWNITSDKLNNLEISETEEKIIFVSDTERLYVDFNGTRTEYRNIIYVQNINNIPQNDGNKNSIYFEVPTKKLYYYIDNEYFPLNPDPESMIFIGKYTDDSEITQDILDTFVELTKHRESKINDLIIDKNSNQWLKVDNGTEEDWINLNQQKFATYESLGLVKIKKNAGLIIENGVLSLNLLDEDRTPGQIVILNETGKIDEDVFDVKIEWSSI